MGDFIKHYVVGNDRPPLAIAFVRALIGAVVLGGSAAVTAWSGTDDAVTIARAGLGTALSFLAWRGAAEGWIDTRKNGGS